MKFLICLFLSLVFYKDLFCQASIKQYIQENAVPFSISNLNDQDFSALGQAIGNARVVMLGEQDHGDAPTMQVKSSIVRYLHEKLGFEVLAFESEFYGLTRGWEPTVAGQIPLTTYIKQNVLPVWTRCTECNGLFDYVKTCFPSKRPLILAGFDSQLYTNFSKENLVLEIDSYLKKVAVPFIFTKSYEFELLPLIRSFLLSPYERNPDTLMFQKGAKLIDTILNQLNQLNKQNDFSKKVLENVRSEFIRVVYTSNYARLMEERDRQMAENLKWLSEVKYPDKKIIVWAANYHILKAHSNKLRHQNMGSRYTADPHIEKNSYVLGFTSYGGSSTSADMTRYEFTSTEIESVEEWINKKQYAAAFIDLKAFLKKNPDYNTPFIMAGIRHLQQEDDWTKFYDGIFYIKDMFPCTIKY